MALTVATSQFPVRADIASNARFITRHMRLAKKQGADVVHFPECALSGYAGTDFPSYDGYDWPALRQATESIISLAGDLGLWVILGSTHPIEPLHKPRNCLYIITAEGRLADRYDKRFCAGDASEREGDLAHYSAGNHASVFTINGVRCGALICHDYRYPELYRDYQQRGVELMFHAYHAGGVDAALYEAIQTDIRPHAALNHGATYPEITMPATMQSYAANNYMWISCSNSAARQSCWPAFMVRPDGVITGKLTRHRPGLLLTRVDPNERWYDSTSAWRERAINGHLHSGTSVEDTRSKNRTAL